MLTLITSLKQKSAATEVTALKNATPIVAKQVEMERGVNPSYPPPGFAFLANSKDG